MSAKRSRICRPSSAGNTTAISPAEIYDSSEVRWPVSPSSAMDNLLRLRKDTSPMNRPVIFTISSPVYDYDGDRSVKRMQFGSFLEKCCYCRSRIGEDDEVFMYSTRAFCTEECREKQIEIDNGLQRLCATSKLPRSGKHGGGCSSYY